MKTVGAWVSDSLAAQLEETAVRHGISRGAVIDYALQHWLTEHPDVPIETPRHRRKDGLDTAARAIVQADPRRSIRATRAALAEAGIARSVGWVFNCRLRLGCKVPPGPKPDRDVNAIAATFMAANPDKSIRAVRGLLLEQGVKRSIGWLSNCRNRSRECSSPPTKGVNGEHITTRVRAKKEFLSLPLTRDLLTDDNKHLEA
jgi:hypothetical protein